MNETAISTTLLSVTQSVGVLSTMLPPISEVRRANGDPSTAADVRMAEVTGSALALSIGAAASLLTKNHAPFLAALVACIAVVSIYEKMLSTPPREATTA